jgi:hypothetical protein
MLQGLIESEAGYSGAPMLCGLRSFYDAQWWGGITTIASLSNPIYGSSSNTTVIFQEPLPLEPSASHIISMSHNFAEIIEKQGLPIPQLFSALPYFYIDKHQRKYCWGLSDKRQRAEYENGFELLIQTVVHRWIQVNATSSHQIPDDEVQLLQGLLQQYAQKGTRHVQKSEKAYFLFVQELMYPTRQGHGLAAAVKEAETIGLSGKLLLHIVKRFKELHDN